MGCLPRAEAEILQSRDRRFRDADHRHLHPAAAEGFQDRALSLDRRHRVRRDRRQGPHADRRPDLRVGRARPVRGAELAMGHPRGRRAIRCCSSSPTARCSRSSICSAKTAATREVLSVVVPANALPHRTHPALPRCSSASSARSGTRDASLLRSTSCAISEISFLRSAASAAAASAPAPFDRGYDFAQDAPRPICQIEQLDALVLVRGLALDIALLSSCSITLPSVERSKAITADSRVASMPGRAWIAISAAYCTGVRSNALHSSTKSRPRSAACGGTDTRARHRPRPS